MPDSQAKKEWMKANTTMVTVKMTNKGDADIMAFLEGKAKATVIKQALREYMERHDESKGADTMIDIKYFDQAVELMDDEIREDIHMSGEYDDDKEGFLREYERRHLEKYGKPFEV